MRHIKFIWMCILSKFSPVIQNTVFFDSFLGQYSDNPRYISEMLHSLQPTIQIVWDKSKKSREELPDYVKVVQRGSREYYYYALKVE